MTDRIDVAGIPVDNVSIDEALSRIEGFVISGKPHFGVAINPEKVIKAKQDRVLAKLLRKSDLNFCDGVGVIWAVRIFYHEHLKARVTGVDLFLKLLELADKKHWRLYLLGARPEALKKVVSIVGDRYPGIVMVGWHDGYFTPADEPALVEEIAQAHPDILFAGMGSPKQEKFISSNKTSMGVPFSMGIGGSYNVLSGEFKRAPAAVQRLGLEWLYRFLLDPKRLPRILSLPRFVGIVLRSPRRHVESVDFFGISISNKDMDDLLAIADEFIQSHTPHLVVTLNGEMAARAFRDKEFLSIVQQAHLVVADGVGIVWGVRMLGSRIEHRVPGIEFANNLLELAQKKGYRIYLLGAKPEVIKRAAANIQKRFPTLVIAGFHSGYFDALEEASIVREIHDLHVDIILVGMGGGIQEKWIWHHRDELGTPLAIGVGGTFDVWSGMVRRAPRFVQKTGTEWLYRLIVQPSRIARMGSIFYFMFQVLAHRRSGRGC